MLTPQVTLFRFCKMILIGIVTAIFFGLITILLKPLLVSLQFSEALTSFTVALVSLVAIAIINTIDLLSTSLISKEDYPHKRRSLWASTLNHLLFGIFLLPWLGIVIVRQIDSVSLWFLVAAYAIVMRIANGFWEVIYSKSATRTLKIYGEVGALLSLFIGTVYFSELLQFNQESQIAVIIIAWLLLEYAWEHILGLLYYGFNQFYGVTFLHDFMPKIAHQKTPQPAVNTEIEELESENLGE